MEEKKKTNRGGKRVGAGRPRSLVETVTVSFLMEKELCNLIKDSSIKNRGEFLNFAVRYVMADKYAFDEYLKYVEENREKR